MLYRIWRLLRRRFWIYLTSHWEDKHGNYYFGEWEQKGDKIRFYHAYRQIGGKCEDFLQAKM